MTRGNQRDKAREAAQKKLASTKAGNNKTGSEMQRDKEKTAQLMKQKQAKADEKKRLEVEAANVAKKEAEEEKKRLAEVKKKDATKKGLGEDGKDAGKAGNNSKEGTEEIEKTEGLKSDTKWMEIPEDFEKISHAPIPAQLNGKH